MAQPNTRRTSEGFLQSNWGPVSKFEQDHNSTVATGGTYLYDIDYTYERATGGRNTVRRTGFTLPSGNAMTDTYLNTNGLHDDELSRVSQVKDGSVTTARYFYNGAGTVVGTTYPEADVFSHQYSGSTFPDLDRFNRVTSSRWTKDLATDIDFFDTDVAYDRNSNVELVEDNVHGGRDVDYSIDALNRLIKAEEGTWNGSSITSRSRQEIWTLTQTGNWDLFKLDLNGDNDFIDASELNDDRTHNKANELTARDTDDNGTDNYTLTHDANGNLTDDGHQYLYVYDAFGRLRQVKSKSFGNPLVAEYRYNGLNHRITSHQDTDTDGDVDANDTILHFVYDERWRVVAVFEDDHSTPHEEFVHHNAGMDGFGGSSYIDDVVFRDRDTNVTPGLDERIYYCQNWRHDVIALVTDTGKLVEQVRYSPYGVPFGYPTGDTNSDGDWDAGDNLVIASTPSYDVRKDANLDGVVNSSDVTHANSITGGYQTLGRTVLTSTGVESVLGYAGYVHDAKLAGAKWHVRHRVLDSELGRWLTRDPAGYGDSADLYEYIVSMAVTYFDPSGLCTDCLPPYVPPGPGAPPPPMPPGWGDTCGCATRYPPPGNIRERQACRNGCWFGTSGLNCYVQCRNIYAPGSSLFGACVDACKDARDPSLSCRSWYYSCIQGCKRNFALCGLGIVVRTATRVVPVATGGYILGRICGGLWRRAGIYVTYILALKAVYDLSVCTKDYSKLCKPYCQCMFDKCTGLLPATWACGSWGTGPNPWPGPIPPAPGPAPPGGPGPRPPGAVP